ncbi:DUF6340 family protein [Muriicola sp.]|uniref:DUF6340 family protein n=1 Tax=Muriicola sp. TaxID=2020856 RepID=UPI003563454D
MRKLILIFAIIWVSSSCKSTYTVTVYNLEPAPVVLAKDIKRIGIINEVGDRATSENIASLEALVKAADIKLSREGTEAALEGLLAELQKDKRFDTVMILSKTASLWERESNETKTIPWRDLKNLCLQNQLDAVFSLAFYQTDTRIMEKKSSMEELDMLRTRVVIPARELTLETLIENGWRIYDPFEEKVLDEIEVNEQVVTQAKGEDALNALRSMTDRADSLVSKSRGSGSAFGMRLKPSNKAVERQIYIKGSPLLVQAEQAVIDEDWLEAARLWQMDLNHEKPAIRAMACHNMAVLYEIKNDLDKALEWAIQARTHDDGKAHSQYLETLKTCASQKLQAEKQWEAIALLRK